MQITRLRYTRPDYSALGFLYSTYNAGVRYKAARSPPSFSLSLTRRCFIVLLSATGKHLEISEWANYRTVGTEVVGGRIARFDWSPRGTRDDCGSRGDCGNPRDESLSFNLCALSRVLFLFQSWPVLRVNFFFLLYARAKVCRLFIRVSLNDRDVNVILYIRLLEC